ncbi:MAG: C39 family peptidase [Chthoniobacterales bacterium]
MKASVCVPFFASFLFSLSAFSAPSASDVNAIFEIPIFGDSSLWEENTDDVGKRLQWPLESETSYGNSYRLYPKQEIKVLGTRPFSLALYGEGGHPESISMVFANKGDVATMVMGEVDFSASEARKKQQMQRAMRDYGKFIRADKDTIAKRLTELLGGPVSDRLGETSQTRERVSRWDWNGSSILLAAPRDEYVAVRIVSTKSLESAGTARIKNAEMQEILAKRIEKRPNGDVILKDVPMVDQGPKGYCVPATWERALRYMGIPADMYVLAMAGGTDVGGGTSTKALAASADALVRSGGRRSVVQRSKVDVRSVAKAINEGKPIMWTMYSMDEINERLKHRMKQRETTTDWEGWAKSLDSYRKTARKLKIDKDRGHVCMIIGYNKDTDEVAVSDSWGSAFAERWMTVEEAEAVSQGEFYIIEI